MANTMAAHSIINLTSYSLLQGQLLGFQIQQVLLPVSTLNFIGCTGVSLKVASMDPALKPLAILTVLPAPIKELENKLN